MPIPNSIDLAAAAGAEGLDCVLVGGNAVNLYTYHRTTFDVDLLIRETDRASWTSYFERWGYATFHATNNFIRMRFAADPAGALPVDLMLADADTFQKIRAGRREREVGGGARLAIPDPLHLIAMKLHALRSAHRVEGGVDFADVTQLIRAEKIDVRSPAFREILDRHASEAIKARILGCEGIAAHE